MNMNYVRFPDVFFVTRHVGFGIHFEEATNAFVTFMTCAIHATLLIVNNNTQGAGTTPIVYKN